MMDLYSRTVVKSVQFMVWIRSDWNFYRIGGWFRRKDFIRLRFVIYNFYSNFPRCYLGTQYKQNEPLKKNRFVIRNLQFRLKMSEPSILTVSKKVKILEFRFHNLLKLLGVKLYFCVFVPFCDLINIVGWSFWNLLNFGYGYETNIANHLFYIQ